MGCPAYEHQRGQGDAALSGARWFPRPASVTDIEVVGPEGDLDAETLFGLLVAEDAEEWTHRVGVAGRADGSAKTTTRLLASGGRVLKTNLDRRAEHRHVLRAQILDARTHGARAGAWHPSKRWALVRVDGGWLPLSICAELRTLRDVDRLEDRLGAWTRMLEMGVEVARRCGLGLDLNPANFGFERHAPRVLHYLDDELYPAWSHRQLADAMAARIPEEPAASESTWRGFGRRARRALEGCGLSRAELDHVADELAGYPLAESFHVRREALVDALRERSDARPVAAASAGERVCVLADVHANLYALDAVLAAAADRGATSFLFLGDAIGYGPHPRECVERLASLATATYIRGNHDHAIATGRFDVGMNRLARSSADWTRARLGHAELAWLASLPVEHRGDGWMAVHGAPRDPNRFFAYVYDLTYEENLAQLDVDGVSLCFHGHTHVPLVHVALPSGPTKRPAIGEVALPPRYAHLVNPGSVGQPRDGDPRAAFAIWEPAAQRIAFDRVTYRIDRTLNDIENAGLPSELFTRLAQGV